MRRMACTIVLVGATVLAPAGVAAAQQQQPCDTYSGACVDPGNKTIDNKGTKVRGTKRTLPFTGAEATLLAVVGAGAVAGGGTLVAASRRRARRTA